MNTRYSAVVGLGILLSIASPASSAEMPKMTPEQQAVMAQAVKLGTPGENHKVLEPFIGKWTNTVKFWMKPGDKAQESKGTNENAWILGGRFVKQDYHGTMMDNQPFDGVGITGYDNVKGEYQSIWLDTMMTGMMYGTGSYDAAKKTVSIGGTFSCPMTGDKATWYRSEWKVISNDRHQYLSYGKGPDGKEFKNMVIDFTRAK